jgi:hypothetical protein
MLAARAAAVVTPALVVWPLRPLLILPLRALMARMLGRLSAALWSLLFAFCSLTSDLCSLTSVFARLPLILLRRQRRDGLGGFVLLRRRPAEQFLDAVQNLFNVLFHASKKNIPKT